MDRSAWKTLLAYYQASQIRPLELEDTSFTEMRDAGDLGLIADQDLRAGLESWIARARGAGLDDDAMAALFTDTLRPPAIRSVA